MHGDQSLQLLLITSMSTAIQLLRGRPPLRGIEVQLNSKMLIKFIQIDG
jgi:hypothetical protein